MVKAPDISITSLDVITAFDMAGEYKFTLDELQDATIANSEETTDQTGKGGRLINRLKRNKTVTVSGNNGMLSSGMLETQSGGQFTHKNDAIVSWTDYLVVTNDAATTSFKATGTAGAEIKKLFVRNADGSAGTEYVQDATASQGKFAYTPASGTITFAADEIEDGTEVVVVYNRAISGEVLENMSDNYAGKLQLFIDATGEDKCSNVYHIQFYVPKADFNGTFDITLGGDQAVHAFEAVSLATACGHGVSTSLWTYTIFGDEQEDIVGA